MKILATKRELTPEDLTRPYPLIFRETFEKDTQILKEKGGLSDYQIIREEFFENGVLLKTKMTIFGQDVTAISKSIVSKETDRGGIYLLSWDFRRRANFRGLPTLSQLYYRFSGLLLRELLYWR